MTVKADLVPVAPLRERFLALERDEGLKLSDVAARCGWVDRGKPDMTRAKRALGLGAKLGDPHEHVTWATAADLCRALHLDPVDIGL